MNECRYCGKQCNDEFCCDEHRKYQEIYDEGEYVPCPECGKLFRSLVAHMHKHSDAKFPRLKLVSKTVSDRKKVLTKKRWLSLSREERDRICIKSGVKIRESWYTKSELERAEIAKARGLRIQENWVSKTEEEKKEHKAKQSKGWDDRTQDEKDRFRVKRSIENKKRWLSMPIDKKESYKLIVAKARATSMKRIETRTLLSKSKADSIANGSFSPYSCFISGRYRNVYFSSSYEYRMMKVYDILGIQWTRNHGIVIPWHNPKKSREGLNANYPPDFLVNGSEIVETKGWDSESVQLKAEATRKFVTESNERYKSYSLLFDIDIVEWEKKAVEKLGWTYEQYRVQIEKELSYYEQKRNKKRVYLRSLRKEAA